MSRSEALAHFLSVFHEKIRSFYGDRLVGVLQFGSTVNQIKPETDLDVLLVVEQLPPARHDRYAEWERFENSLRDDLRTLAAGGMHLFLSPVIKSPEEASRFHSIYLDFPDCSAVIDDRRGFLASLIAKISDYIKTSGAIKKRSGTLWYWDLAPHATYKDKLKIGW